MQSTNLSKLTVASDAVNLMGNTNQILQTNFINTRLHDNKEEIYYIKTSKHKHKVTIKQELWGYSLNFGGKRYEKCIHIGVQTDIDGNVKTSKISHIQSEQECSFDKVLENKDTIQFIQAALTYCKQIFPTLEKFEFDDMSHIECGVTEDTLPPRRRAQPFSLPHFSIAKYGMTWYEQKFNAKMLNHAKYKNYRDKVRRLENPITLPFDTFIAENYLSADQSKLIEPYYLQAKSWHDLFNLIPKNKQCDILYNWLYSFINRLINNSFDNIGWYIDANTMRLENITIMNTLQEGGTRKVIPKTMRNKRRGMQIQHF